MIKRLVLGVTIGATLLMTMVACNDEAEEEPEEDRIIPVETASIEKDDLIVENQFFGRLSPEQMIPVLLENPGEIDELLVENDETVEKDDIIAKIKTPVGTQNIRAPEAGEVIKLDVKEGEKVSGEEPLAFIVDLDQLKLELTVTEKDRSLFKKDKKLDVTVEEKSYEFTTEDIAKLPDDTGLYPISGTIKNKKSRLLPGMIATINVPKKLVSKSLLIPTEALIEDSDETYIYTIEDDIAHRTNVTVIEAQSDLTAIEGDVAEGDTIVINGQLTLFDGAKVEVVNEENES